MERNIPLLVEKLRLSDVFGQLTEPERTKLADLAVRKVLKKGDVICFQGDETRFVLYIDDGELRSVITSPDGREHIVSAWGKGEEFWSHTLLDDKPVPSTLEAIQKGTIIYMWPGETVLDLVLDNRQATRALIRRQTTLIRKRREKIFNLVFNPVASRLARLILDKFDNEENPTLTRDLTLEDMAAMVATSPEVICRTIYQFQDEGYLSVDRTSITLHDHEALEKLVLKD